MEGMVDVATSHRWLKGKRVFVTGGTGLVGSWLLDALVRIGADVVALLRDEVPSSVAITSGTLGKVVRARGELESFPQLCRIIAEYQPEVIFHLGAQTQVGIARNYPLGTLEANVRGTWNLLEALRVYGSNVNAVVVASSDKAYGESEYLPYKETHPLRGTYPYDVSKSCVDLISRSYAITYDIPIVIARCGNIYGGGDLNFERIVPGTIRDVLAGKRPVIRSDGKYVRDYIYVKDVVGAYLTLGRAVIEDPSLKGEAFNFGLDKPVTVLELVNIILRLMKRLDIIPEIRNTAKAEIHNQYLSSEKARKMLGWHPLYTLETGLAETVQWYTDYFAKTRGDRA